MPVSGERSTSTGTWGTAFYGGGEFGLLSQLLDSLSTLDILPSQEALWTEPF